MTTPTIPALPDSFVESEDETVALFVPPALKAWRKLTELSGTYVRVMRANEDAENALEDSADPQAVAYREAKSASDDKVEALNSELEDRIKALRAEYKAKRDEATSGLKDLRNETLKVLGNAMIEDVDQNALAESYLKNYKALSNLAKLVKDDYPDLTEFVKTQVPSRFAQTPGTGNSRGSSGPRGWTPRLVSVTVNGKAVSPTTLGAAAKEIGFKASENGRSFLAKQLLAAVVTPDNLSTDADSPSTFAVKYNDTVFNVAVVGKSADSDDDNE